MNNSLLPSQNSETAISITDVVKYSEGWLLDCELKQHSASTLQNRELYISKLVWFLRHKEYTSCGVDELRSFFHHITSGHKDPQGRFGNPALKKPVKAGTVAAYHRHIRAFFNWVVDEGRIASSPMVRITPPVDRPDEVRPFTDAEVNSLIDAAKTTQNAKRDEAILWLLLDTGIRASELCALRFQDMDMGAKTVIVQGKGGKSRSVPFGRTPAKVLWQYLKDEGREPDEPLFLSERGAAFTRLGLLQMIERLGKKANLSSVRTSPHTFRHTFAVSFLRNGGNQFSLMSILGHTSLEMTSRYVQFAQADVERQHRQFSPADNLKKGRK